MIVFICQILFFIALVGIFTVLAGYPLLVWAGAVFAPRRKNPLSLPPPRISLIVVIHNGADLVIPKFENSLTLDYPKDRFEIIFYSDGSDDGTPELMTSLNHPGVRILIDPRHEGKDKGLNRAARIVSGKILVFSDVDAMLQADALSRLTRHFADASVGGVCGRRCVGERKRPLSNAQRLYIALDGCIKQWESATGSITANDGKLYAIRKSLFKPLPPGVTDDLYNALSVVRRDKRFIYEPDAVAVVRLPSRDTRHEVARRRRIVSRSLNGIRRQREVLDPRRHGIFALRLLVNKVLRRFLPLFLLILLPTSIVLHARGPFFALVVWAQLAFYLAVAAHVVIPIGRRGSGAAKIASTAFYICAGLAGTLLGVVDFVTKPPPAKWKPVKKD